MITPDAVRARLNSFESGLRGFHAGEVQAYLARIALIFEVLGDESGPLPAIPPEASPGAIRRQEFTIVWRGLNRDEVGAFLDELAVELEERLARNQTAPAPTLEFGSNFRARVRDGQASGLFREAAIVTGNHRRNITFCTPEGLTRDLAARLDASDTCLVSDMIIVSEISADAMKNAVADLHATGEL